MPNSKPNARRPAMPRPAAEAALADDAGAPLRRALWLDALDQQLRPLLPPGLAPHCRLANVTGGQLVFLTDSPVWRARLRLAEAELLDAARSIGLEPTAVVVRTTTSPLRPNLVAASAMTHVSATARQAVADALASLRESRPGDSAAPERAAPGDPDRAEPPGSGRPPQATRDES